MGLLKGFG